MLPFRQTTQFCSYTLNTHVPPVPQEGRCTPDHSYILHTGRWERWRIHIRQVVCYIILNIYWIISLQPILILPYLTIRWHKAQNKACNEEHQPQLSVCDLKLLPDVLGGRFNPCRGTRVVLSWEVSQTNGMIYKERDSQLKLNNPTKALHFLL